MLLKEFFIYEADSVKDALKRLNKTAEKVLLVVDNEAKLLGTITDGDIRRFILRGEALEKNIEGIYNKNPIFIKKRDFSVDKAKTLLVKNKIEMLPILDEENIIVDFITWAKVFSDKEVFIPRRKLNIPVVIMAGGKGVRLEPFTKILPKALIPIGDKPIIEIIMEEFKKQGVSDYYLSLNHKKEMVEAYFNNTGKDYKINYIREEDFLGTAGSLKFLKGKVKGTFIVTNCDIIVRADFEDVIDFHNKQKSSLTVLSAVQHYKIPYGVIQFKEKGEVTDIFEKPEYTMTVNTGVYTLDEQALQFIPENSYFDMTELIKSLIHNNRKVVTYPVNESEYIDIGQWEEYRKAVDKLQFLPK